MYSSTAGLLPSLVLAGLALLASLILRSGRLSAFHAIGAGAASFAVSFSILNLAVQAPALTRGLLSQELENGVLVLRVISVTAALAFLRLMIAAAREEGFSLAGDPYGEDDHILYKEQYRRSQWPSEQIASQATVLLLVLCLLWALPLLGRTSLLIALLNWAFAFTADDFFMAASYRVEREVKPPKFDAVLIWSWRTLTLVLFGLVMFQQFSRWVAFLILILVVFLLAQPSLTRGWHTFKFAFETLGIEPSEDTVVEGSVVRLFREHAHGPGKVVILGVADGNTAVYRFHLELNHKDYGDALRAHR